MSSAFSLDRFPVWIVPGRKPLGKQRARTPFHLVWGSQTDTAVLAASVSKEGRQACGGLSRESPDSIPSWKNHSNMFLQNHQKKARADSRILYQIQEPQKQLPMALSAAAFWKFRSFTLFRANYSFLVAPPNLGYMRMIHTCRGTPPLGLGLEARICIMELLLPHRLK